MKFCNDTPVYTAQQTEANEDRSYHPWPLAASCVMKSDLRASLCANHQIITGIQKV